MVDSTMGAELGNLRLGSAASVETVISVDDVPITYQKSGSGPPVVMTGGGLNNAAMFAELVDQLSPNFTVYNYDRRGRGRSGDGNPDEFTVDLELADMEAVVRAAGEGCYLFANCTGGMLAVHAAARGLPVAKMALYEPPFESPPVSDDYMDRLRALLAEDRRADAVELFYRESVRFSEETISYFKQHPIWDAFLALAPTLVYDCALGIDYSPVPIDLLPSIEIPTLVIDGGDSPQWIFAACESLADGLPNGTHHREPGESHVLNQKTTGPLITSFFTS